MSVPKPAHPSFSNMVIAAINDDHDRKGTSLAQIKKFIGSKYNVDINKSKAYHLRKAVKKLVGDKLLEEPSRLRYKLIKAPKLEKPKPKKIVAKKTATPKKTKKPAAKKAAIKKPAGKTTPSKAGKKKEMKPKTKAKAATKKATKPSKTNKKAVKKPSAKTTKAKRK